MEQAQKDLLKLVKRSQANADADGWIKVSDVLWPAVRQHAEPELIELRDDQHCRLTDDGRVVLKWL